jgi:hypothetical protein
MYPAYQVGNYLSYQPPPPPPKPPLPFSYNTTSGIADIATSQCTYNMAAEPTTSYQYYNVAIPAVSTSDGVQGLGQEQPFISYDDYQNYAAYYNYYGYGEQSCDDGYYEYDGKQKHHSCEICNVICSGDANFYAHLCEFLNNLIRYI